MAQESAIPLTQLGDESNQKHFPEMGICIENRRSKGESEDRSVRKNCFIRCFNFVRAKTKLFWLLFLIKTICFMAEIGIYAKQAEFISATNYSAAMTKFNGSLEAFEEEKNEHLSEHQTDMCGLILLDLLILVFIFVEAGPYLWTLIGRLLKSIIGFFRRVLWCLKWENRSDSSETLEEIKHSMFASFLFFVREAFIGIFSLDVDSILSSLVTAAAWSVAVGIGILTMKLPKYVSWFILWMLTIAVVYIMTDIHIYLTELRKSFPENDLKKEIRNFSVQVGFDPENVYITKNTENGITNDIPLYYADMLFHKRIVFRDTAIGYSYDDLERDDDLLKLLEAFEKYSENDTTPNIALQTVMDRIRSLKTNNNRKVLAVFAHEIGHWTHNHVPWKFLVQALNLLLLILLFIALHKEESLYTAFGFKSQPILIGAIIILYMVAAPFNFIANLVVNRFNHLTEFEADRYTVTVGLGPEFCSFWKKLSDRIPFQEHWLFSLYQSTHPPHYERLQALNCSGT
ncbi:peptidase family m48 domain-containing protein [Ditylenchus destructor]|uniref:Peptidase family m48 domain-containing protein n=1 Tax=Ditylenchus destructor TaxID=166010 RepID=A0AAD4MMD3_9BILA|nr:peptidase family m48 domain-containing protein [Ditylenchus destructor]